MLPRGFSPHQAEHFFVDMLQRHVDILSLLLSWRRLLASALYSNAPDECREAAPKNLPDSFDPLQQTSQSGATRRVDRLSRPCLLIPEIHPIVGGILADQIDLLHSFGVKWRISASTDSIDRLRCLPRIWGITQKLQGDYIPPQFSGRHSELESIENAALCNPVCI